MFAGKRMEQCSGEKRKRSQVCSGTGSQKREEMREGREGHDRALDSGGEVAVGELSGQPWHSQEGTPGRGYNGGQR
jgi:hypothetical protein